MILIKLGKIHLDRLIFFALIFISTTVYAQTYTVERVIDGNTIKLTNGERVQLIGIDTPESKPNDKAKRDSKRTGQDVETINKMGQEATEFVKQLGIEGLEGHEVRLEFDVQERDKYGRLLAYAYHTLSVEQGRLIYPKYYVWDSKMLELFINATIIKAGYATPMTIPPNVKYADLFKKLYEEARVQKRGMWNELLIHILPEHQKCQENDDCTVIYSDCTQCGARSGCTTPDTAINTRYKVHYSELHSECSKAAACSQCSLYLSYKSICEGGLCIAIEMGGKL